MISKETIDKIFETALIDEVVGDFVNLKKRGANYAGLSPFTNEKTPSFYVSPAKGIYKCFSTGKGGNAVSFIMEHEHATYPEALRYLAKKYNIDIEDDTPSVEQLIANNERESILIITGFAQKTFTEDLFNTDEGKSIGLSYFKERGFTEETIKKFQLGYCIDDRFHFTNTAIGKGYQQEYLVKSGMSIQSENGKAFDRFFGRVMFPIQGLSGRVIAFGGRTLKNDKKVAKYINSPETLIYHKSNVLYGIFHAKKTIISEDNCYLVEGYTDVISMHQTGIENVVASSGTSLTADQIRLIKRYTNNITILYDGDSAGIKASFRGIDLILEEGLNVKVLLFPDGEDPDSYSRKHGASEVKEFIKSNANDFIVFKTKILLADTANDPIKKAELIKEIINSIALIPDAIIRSVYVKECSNLLDIQEQALITELNKLWRQKLEKKANERKGDSEELPAVSELTPYIDQQDEQKNNELNICEHQEKDIIRILINHGNLKKVVDGEDETGKAIEIETTIAEFIIHELSVADSVIFDNQVYQQIYQEYTSCLETGNFPDPSYFSNHQVPDVNKTAVDLLSSKYLLSEGWERHSIFVESEEKKINRMVIGAIYSLKLQKIAQLAMQLQIKLKKNPAEEELIDILEQHKLLDNVKKEFSAALGRVVLK